MSKRAAGAVLLLRNVSPTRFNLAWTSHSDWRIGSDTNFLTASQAVVSAGGVRFATVQRQAEGSALSFSLTAVAKARVQSTCAKQNSRQKYKTKLKRAFKALALSAAALSVR